MPHEAQAILEVTLAASAEVWRINHGWRRAAQRNGFTLDRETGRWGRRDDEEIEDDTSNPAAILPQTGVKPYVTDRRNVLLLRPLVEGGGSEEFLRTVAYALQRAIQVVYQVEEQEVAVEPIGRGEHRRLLLWEAAEGGTGVWERLLGERGGLAEMAAEALRICHFDPQTGAEDPAWSGRCAVACYDCLLSYANQLEHRFIDRHLVREYLHRLTRAELLEATGERSYGEQYEWLRERTDPASEGERAFLDHLYKARLRLPDVAQSHPEPEIAVQPDFYYERDGLRGVCVFVDGPPHDDPAQAAHDRSVREALADRGYRVIAVRLDRPFEEQVTQHPDVFGGA